MNTNIDECLEKIKKIGEYKLMFFDKGEKEEVTSIEELLKKRFRDFHHRLSGDLTRSTGFSINCKEGIVISMELGEFYPCCGKVVGKKFYIKEKFFGMNHFEISEKDLNRLFSIFMDVIEYILKHCKYSSFSMIVSKPEQPLFYGLIKEIKTYKVMNEFENHRMSNKNLCLEFCKNLW